MTRHASPIRTVSIALACCLLVLSSCRPTVLGPTVPSAYRVILPEASQTMRLRPLELTVHVTDAHGASVEGVPVHFRLSEAWAARADINPPIVVTQSGRATATLSARVAGRLVVDIRVEDLTGTVAIVVLGETPRF